MTIYENAPAVLVTPRGVAQEGLAPMRDQCIPTTTEYARIPLRSRKHPGLYTLVDTSDAEQITGKVFPSRMRSATYAQMWVKTDGRLRKVQLHRHILGVVDPRIQVDHINGDTLDNRRANLRLVTNQQNHFNRKPDARSSSRFKGVSWDTTTKKWAAQICARGVNQFLGRFASETDAARAYDVAAHDLFGEYAYMNFPEVSR